MQSREIVNLQILRGVAALLVVLHHVQPLLNSFYGQSGHSYYGAFGVDIFFVISGFVMFYTNRSFDREIPVFVFERFVRIVPLYWLATFAVIACYLVGFRPVGLHMLDLRVAAESFAFIPSTFPDGRRDLILSVAWTLRYELFFYLAFAFTFGLRSQIGSLAILGIFFLSLIALGRFAGPVHSIFDFYTYPIILEFLFGAILAIIYMRWNANIVPKLAPVGVVILLLGLGLPLALDLAGVPLPKKDEDRFLILGAPALLVVAGALLMERGGWVLRLRFPLLLGAASYALYLFHPLILHIMMKGAATLLPGHGMASAIVASILAVATCIAAAIAIHLGIERPMMKGAKGLIARVRPLRTSQASA